MMMMMIIMHWSGAACSALMLILTTTIILAAMVVLQDHCPRSIRPCGQSLPFIPKQLPFRETKCVMTVRQTSKEVRHAETLARAPTRTQSANVRNGSSCMSSSERYVQHCHPQGSTRSSRAKKCGACMTRTPPENRRRLTGGARRPQEGILRHAPGQDRTPIKA